MLKNVLHYKPRTVPTRRQQMQRLIFAFVGAVVIYGGGTLLYQHLLHDSLLDAFYHVAWTSVLHPLEFSDRTASLEVVTICLAVAGLAFFSYLLANAVDIVRVKVSPEARFNNRLERRLKNLKDHYIICGYGRIGRRAAQEFTASGVDFVILDIDEDVCVEAIEEGMLAVHGNAHEDAALTRAGIETARGLVATADSDTQNLYIVLSARTRRPDLLIIARAGNIEAEEKLRLVGANRVVQPYSVAGVEVANIALKPQLAGFLDLVSSHRGADLRFEQILIDPSALGAGHPIREIWNGDDSRALIVAIHGVDGSLQSNPLATTLLPAGATVIALGTEAQLGVLHSRLGMPGNARQAAAQAVAHSPQPDPA